MKKEANYWVAKFNTMVFLMLLLSVSIKAQLTVHVNSSAGTVSPGTAVLLTAQISGGNPPYTYSWDGGSTYSSSTTFSGNGPGLYCVEVRDNTFALAAACDSVYSTEVPYLNISVISYPVCNGATCMGRMYVGYHGFVGTVTAGGDFLGVNNAGGTDSAWYLNVCAGNHIYIMTDAVGNTIQQIVNVPATIYNPFQAHFTEDHDTISPGVGINIKLHLSGGAPEYVGSPSYGGEILGPGSYQYFWNSTDTIRSLYSILPGDYYAGSVHDGSHCMTNIPDLKIYGFTGPVAKPDYFNLWPISNTDLDITGNDVDQSYWDSTTTTFPLNLVSISQQPQNGTAIIIHTTGYNYARYIPNGHNIPIDSFKYVICDTIHHLCDTGSVYINGYCAGCVWPGDMNDDAIVDNSDLLSIGLGYGTYGPTRQNASIAWVGQSAPDWVDTLQDGTNYKFIDSNGDGWISADDTMALMQNFSSQHPRNGGSDEWRMAVPGLYIVLTPDTTHAGDTMYTTILLGDINTPANDVYGLAFTMNYDVAVVDTGRTQVVFGNSWLGTAVDKISIAKDLKQGELKCALTRIDHASRSGSGQIGMATFVITTDNINGKNLAYYTDHVWLSDVIMIDNNGNYLAINAGQDSSLVEFTPTGIEEVEWQNAYLKIQPNPANDVVTVSVSPELVGGQVRIMGVDGKFIEEEKIVSPNFQIPTLNLANGIYMLQAVSGVRTLNKRLVIAR